MNIHRDLTSDALYETDFHAWLLAQAAALKSGDAACIDWTNLAEEIEDMGRNQRHQLESRLEVLIAHLVKLALSRAEAPRAGWRATVREQRRGIARVLRDNPSLRRYAGEVFPDALRIGTREALEMLCDAEPIKAADYRRAARSLPALSLDDVLMDDFFPPSPEA